MNIAQYFAKLQFLVEKSEIKKVDDFLNKIQKGLEKSGKEANVTDKATKKVKKSTDEATKSIKQQLTWQEKLNKVKQGELKLQFAIAQNQKQLAKNFKQSVDKMVIKPSTTKKLKEQQALYDNLFGGRKTTGATGSNQAAWNRQFNQRIQQLTQQSKVSRAARQADLDAVFALPKAQSNPRVAALLNDRLGYLDGTKNGTLADMADMYRQDEKILKLRQRDIQQRIDNEKKLAEAKDREHKKEEARQRDEERWARREAVRHRDRMQALAARSQMAAEANANRLRIASINASGRASAGRGTNLAHAGGAAGALARYGLAAVPFLGGVYGLSALNKQNQEIVSAEFGAKAIMGSEAGTRNMDWLREQANRIGFNWLEAAPEFTGFMGAAAPLMGENTALKTFQAFNEFATTRHAPALARTRALMALKQMSAKGTIMSEELFLQLGEAQGFGELPMMFAEAYQEFLGGNLKGADAAKFLKDAMKEGKVKTADLMPIVTGKMSEKAAPTLAQSAKSSQSEQARFQNAANMQVLNANKAGVESGYARLFRAFTVAMEESTPLVESLARGFDRASIHVAEIVLNMQSIGRFFDGRDSWFGDKFFGTEERRNAAFEWLGSIRTLLSEVGELVDTIFRGWGMIFDLLMSSEVMSALTSIQNSFTNIIGAINSMANGDYTGAMQQMRAAFLTQDSSGRRYYDPASHASSLEAMKVKTAADRRIVGFPGTVGIFPMSQEEQATKAMAGSYGSTMQNNVVVQSGAIVVHTQATNGDELARELEPYMQQMFTVQTNKMFTEAMLTVPQKE